MDIDVRRRLVIGVSSNLFNQAVSVVVQIASVPILLAAWGTHLYGEWLILFAIPAFLSFSDLGFSISAANSMTGLVAKGHLARAREVFWSLGTFAFLVSISGLAIATALVFALPIGSWFSLPMLGNDDAQWIVWLLAADVFVRMIVSWVHAGFRAGGDYGLHVSLESLTRLLQYAALWGVAGAGGGPVVATAGLLAVRVATTPFIVLLVFHRHRWLRRVTGRLQLSGLRPLVRPALANTAMPIAQALQIQGSVLVVGMVLGPAAVVVFSTLRTLTRVMIQLVTVLTLATEPEVAAAYGTGDTPLLRFLFVSMMRAALWLGLGVAVAIFLLGDDIVRVWTGSGVAYDHALAAWLLASGVANLLWAPGLTVLTAANRHIRAAAFYVGGAAGSLVVSAALTGLTRELATAGAALLVMDTVLLTITPFSAARLVQCTLRGLVRDVTDPRPLCRALLRFKSRQRPRPRGSDAI